ncbi:MAG: heme exporter protein CcmB [Gammaproteobacteria bacterium]|nr:heme exporter protein CcmB [Gammaproteobacteria bacterium]
MTLIATKPVWAIVRRDLLIAFRNRSQLLNPLLFNAIVVVLFPLGIGPESSTLRVIAPGVIWVAALLATLLALDQLFRSDHEDGTLEQLVLSRHPLILLIGGKIFAHWLITGLPLILLAPLLGMFMGLPADTIMVLMISLALGTPVLNLIGAIGAALTLSVRNGGALLSLVILPLYIPVLIFAAGAVNLADQGLPYASPLYFLAAILVLAISLAPIATAAAVKISVN